MKELTIEDIQLLGPAAYIPTVIIKFEGEEEPQMICDIIFDELKKVYGPDPRKWRGKKLQVDGLGQPGKLKLQTCD